MRRNVRSRNSGSGAETSVRCSNCGAILGTLAATEEIATAPTGGEPLAGRSARTWTCPDCGRSLTIWTRLEPAT